jgi:hypothetical protein
MAEKMGEELERGNILQRKMQKAKVIIGHNDLAIY